MTATKLGDITLSKQTGTILTLATEKKYVTNDVYFTIAAPSGAGAVTVASTDANVVDDSANRNISGSIGSKSTSAPSTGYYFKIDASGTGTSTITTAGWLAEGSLGTATASNSFYFPVTAATITQNAPTINNSTGVVTATSTITAGYTPADTKTNSLQLTVQAAQTITPTTTDQTIAANRWLTGAQTIKGDSNLLPENIKKGITIFGVTGTYEGEILPDATGEYFGTEVSF